MLKVAEVKEIYELKGAGLGVREIARELDISRNTVRRYLKSPEAMRPGPRPPRRSKLDAYMGHIDRRMSEGLDNCVVLHREVCALGYTGSYSTVVQYVRPRWRQRQPEATMRFETAPGEQAQVDWGSLSYLGEDGRRHSVWVSVMTMGWSRACYVELVRRAEHPGRELPAEGETPGGSVSFPATLGNRAGGGQRQLPGLTESLSNNSVFAQFLTGDDTRNPLACITAARPPFSVVLTGWLSVMAPLGVASRPSLSRTMGRSASSTRSQVPSVRHFLKYHQIVPQGADRRASFARVCRHATRTECR